MFKGLRYFTITTLLIVVAHIGCTKNKEQTPTSAKPLDPLANTEINKPTEKPFEYCSDRSVCKALRENEKKCRTNPNKDVCQKFVESYKKLAVVKDCKRNFDTNPVPSVWLCDEDAEETSYPKLFERSASTLSKTKYDFAQKFYGSEAFRSTLDGAVAEEHFAQSMKVGNRK